MTTLFTTTGLSITGFAAIELPQAQLDCVTWALLHFVWQGTVLAALCGLALRCARAAAPQARAYCGSSRIRVNVGNKTLPRTTLIC